MIFAHNSLLLDLFCGYTYQGSSVSQIYTAINTPTIHYNASYTWHSSNPDSWTRANYPISLTSKSIFDPCPYGYRVPTSNADSKGNSDFFGFTGLTGSGITQGAIWITSWWPTSGYRNYNSAAFYHVGIGGNYSSASPLSTTYEAYSLSIDSGVISLVISDSRSWGFSVRCVQG